LHAAAPSDRAGRPRCGSGCLLRRQVREGGSRVTKDDVVSGYRGGRGAAGDRSLALLDGARPPWRAGVPAPQPVGRYVVRIVQLKVCQAYEGRRLQLRGRISCPIRPCTAQEIAERVIACLRPPPVTCARPCASRSCDHRGGIARGALAREVIAGAAGERLTRTPLPERVEARRSS
jgi:hypothetical protein